MSSGVVTWFHAKKGFGFIEPDDGTPEIFVHSSRILDPERDSLQPGQHVTFEIGHSAKGPQAIQVQIIEPTEE